MPTSGDPSETGHGLTIQEASDILGVPAPTLRSWERRYAVPTTTRSLGGHRRYQAAELVELRLMRDEIAIGRPAADAARRVREILNRANAADGWVRQMLIASQDLNATALRDVLDRAVDQLGLGPTLDDVLMPAMRQIGSWWEQARCDIGQESFTTEVVRGWLAKLTTLSPPPLSDRWVLLAVGPRDMHTLGLEVLAALLADQRIGARTLGPRTPMRVVATAAVATSAAAVVIVSHLPTQRRSAVDSLVAVADSGVPTFYAGNAFATPSSRKGVPGTYLGNSIAGAVRLISAAVPMPDGGSALSPDRVS